MAFITSGVSSPTATIPAQATHQARVEQVNGNARRRHAHENSRLPPNCAPLTASLFIAPRIPGQTRTLEGAPLFGAH
jgi:hypothetical protein